MNDPNWINGDDPDFDEEFGEDDWDPADPPYNEDDEDEIAEALNMWEAEKYQDPWYA